MLSPSIIRNIRFLEWGFILIHAVLVIGSGEKGLSSTNILFYILFFCFSFWFPKDTSNWSSRLYVYLGLSISVIGNFMNVSTDFLLYLYLGKSCFLLGLNETILIVFLVGFGWISSEIISAMNESSDIIFDAPAITNGNNILAAWLPFLGIYIGSSVFIILLFSTLLSEQKSRKEAERLLQQVEALAKDLERTRIARDIHDSLGHTLTNLDIQLQLAQKLRHSSPEQAFQAVDLAQTLSRQGIEDVSYALASMRRTDFDLNQAIEQLISQFRSSASIKTKVDVVIPQLPATLRHQIYLILKECFINIQKHSQASQTSLRGRVSESSLSLEIQDNGIGFIPEQASTGFGLRGISERIQMLGGNLQISSTIGQGTLIKIQIPL